ncbi:MAG: nitroreductase/quinone reductase family protein [Acidobacteria bacterium]|nr:nitroreductase/quinone reductase family protein [Acidobacteriota bacterium]
MRAVRIAGIVLVSYVLIVVAFESLIGFFQPEAPDTLVLTTVGEDGGAVDRVLQGLQSGGQLYVAVNHWPRAWHRRALANPRVRVTREGETRNHMAVPVTGEEYARVDGDHPRPLAFLVLTGFPPRHLLRLDQAE